ncbi:MAG: ribosome-associated translation inhibitor RaiA [Oscillospiraceae bacterium]|nr:ribosome-associated translation inhibitor RaiA [Oscillospiraceae bacterium]
MKFKFNEKKLKGTDELREYAERKIGKIDRFFKIESSANVTFTAERGRFTVEVTIENDGTYFRVKGTTHDIFVSVDSAVAGIERQIRKNKTRLGKKIRAGSLERTAEPAVISDLADDSEETGELKIVRSKMFPVKPMTPEEAVLQMNLLEHEFFVFKNQNKKDAFSIVYKRKQGDYGLIETE